MINPDIQPWVPAAVHGKEDRTNRLDTKTVSLRSPRLRRAGLFLLGLAAIAALLTRSGRADEGRQEVVADISGDVMQGWRVFHDKKCVDCHAVWGQGGREGPDLGRIRAGRLTEGQLAGVMWNHIPKMLGLMEQTGRPPTVLTRDDMADLFTLIFFVRQLDELGDPLRGELILRQKGCSECHETDASGDAIGPDLARWGIYANPIVWAQMMWEHAPMMEEAMRRSDMTWPKLEGADLVHIVAYVRSTGVSGEKTYLRPGSVSRGASLFREKACEGCHPGPGPDLATAELPASLGALASRMWNHSPSMIRVMREQDVVRQPISPQELADIVAYILALGNQDRGGDSARGKRVFVRKGCIQCHEDAVTTEGDGPSLGQLSRDATPVGMATALWNHGATLLERMTEAGLSWPVFNDREMVDLLEYLKGMEVSSEGTESADE